VSIKFKLTLAMDVLVLLAVLMFGGILYTSEKAVLYSQVRSARENVLQSLANVTAESLLNEDDAMLISYTSDLKRIISELEVAYVLDGRTIRAHTDKRLAPRQLPLAYSGRNIRARTDKLLVRGELMSGDGTNITFSRKKIFVNNRAYDIVVGYSDLKVRASIQAALNSVFFRIVKAGAFVILMSTLLAFWLSSLMIKPIKRLIKAFAVTGEGNLNYKMRDYGRRDEIGVLNSEFDRMVDKLRELDQLKKDFVSSVTHELKSPIGAIESYLDLMSYEISRSLTDPASWPAKLPRFLENISFIKQNSNRLLRFIADLLDAARIEKGKFEIVKTRAQIEPVIHDVIKLFLERARASEIELSFSVSGRLPQVYFDAERISQVLANLVSNAVKYTAKGGKVVVTAAVGGMTGASEATVNSADSPQNGGGRAKGVAGRGNLVVRVSVEDTGIGISQADLCKVFEKFYQAPGVRHNVTGPKGTGLGLYIVKSIIEAHGGRTFAESSDKGSKFGFELPV